MFDYNDDERDELFFNNANRDLSVDQNDSEDEGCEDHEGVGEKEEKVDGVVYKGFIKQLPTFGISKYRSGTHSSAEYGDRGVLPEFILDHIHQTRAAQKKKNKATRKEEEDSSYETDVLTFEVEWSDKRICCGVLEFCAEESAYLPSWMLNELECTEGAQLTYRWVKLEPAQYLRLQPLTESFRKLKDVCRFMEEALRRYTTLNKGSTLVVPDPTAPGECMRFKVSETRPENSVHVVNTDPEVDFDTSLCPQTVSISDETLKGGHMLCGPAQNNAGSDNDDEKKEDDYIVCELCGKSILNSNIRVHKLRCKRMSPASSSSPPSVAKEQVHEMTSCKYCGVEIAQGGCEKHMEECGKRTVNCEICGRLVRRVDMDLHKETGCAFTYDFFRNIRIYICDGCGEIFGNKGELTRHAKKCCGYGKEESKREDAAQEEKIFVCPVCQMSYINELEYLEHVSQCIEEDEGGRECCDGEEANYSVLAERKHICKICGKKFRKQSKLRDHMQKIHH